MKHVPRLVLESIGVFVTAAVVVLGIIVWVLSASDEIKSCTSSAKEQFPDHTVEVIGVTDWSGFPNLVCGVRVTDPNGGSHLAVVEAGKP